MYRKFSRFDKKQFGEQIIQAAHFYGNGEQRKYDFPAKTSESTTAGKLRLVRRGDQLHYLYASEDSTSFQLLHTETVPSGPIANGDLRLFIETTKPGQAAVIWKSLKVRAQRMSGTAMIPAYSVAELDDSRDQLRDRVELDLTNKDTLQSFRTWGRDSKFDLIDGGLQVVAPGFKNWHGHGISPHLSLQGDFDAALEVDVPKMEVPAAGGESVVYLEVEFSDPLETAIETKFAISDSGEKAAEIQLRRLGDDGKYVYEELARIPFDEAYQLRIARRNGMAYFIFTSTQDAKPTILGRLEVGNHPLRRGQLRAMIHTAGESRETVVLIKKMTVQAEHIQTLPR